MFVNESSFVKIYQTKQSKLDKDKTKKETSANGDISENTFSDIYKEKMNGKYEIPDENNHESVPLTEHPDQNPFAQKVTNLEKTSKKGFNSHDSVAVCCDDIDKSGSVETKDIEIENIASRILYRISDRPSIQSSFFFAFQYILIALPWNLTAAILVAEVICAGDDEELKAKILSSTILLGGLTTLVQVTFGVRLPVYQGPTTAYVIPLLALKSLEEWQCDLKQGHLNQNLTLGVQSNQSLAALNVTERDHVRDQLVYPRIQMLTGSLIAAGAVHAITGLTGIIGYLMRFIGPVTVIPTILLIGLSIYKLIADFCAMHWGISSITIVITIILSLYLAGKRMPFLLWSRTKGFYIKRFPLQQVLSMLIATMLGWGVAAIFTACGLITDDKNNIEYKARTDARNYVIYNTPWFYFPYPGQFGGVDFRPGLFVAFLTATFTSIVDSIADYYACSKMSQVPPPPVHAVNRGIAIEGIMCAISGTFGIGHGTTTFGQHIGSIGVTRVASRFVFQMFAGILVFCAIVGKFAAVFITIPYPVLGGVQVLGFGMFLGLVLSNLQYIDMQSTRNLAIIGLSLMIGLMIPYWTSANIHVFNTGMPELDSFLKMILTNPNLAGGFLACFLDNTVPGTKKERGLIGWDTGGVTEDGEQPIGEYAESVEVYEIPAVTRYLEKFPFTKYIPFSPTFKRNTKTDA